MVQHGPVDMSSEELSAQIHAVAAAQDELLAECVSLGTTLTRAMDALPGFVPCGHAFSELIVGVAETLGRQDVEELAQVKEAVRARAEHVADHRGVELGKALNPVPELVKLDANSPQRVKLALLAALQSLAIYTRRAMELGEMRDEINVAIARGLALLGDPDAEFKACLAHEKVLGEAYQQALSLGL